ncbi:MAG TPA: translation initiation factor IF-3 [Gemmatimonadota bacterium]|nr:translation initiation factor IF-3 [Gemmatimonadota bacterium]
MIDKNEPRVNNQIRISPVRLVDAEGEQVGIVSIEDARAAAAARGLDLVEVAPGARPPVVRIMDYGKYKYEQARKARESKKKQHQVQVKEIKLRPKIEEHDINFKARHARRFLTEGNKVKLTMRFRGREMTHTELGAAVLERFAGNLEDIGQVEEKPRMEGRQMTMVLAPRKS